LAGGQNINPVIFLVISRVRTTGRFVFT